MNAVVGPTETLHLLRTDVYTCLIMKESIDMHIYRRLGLLIQQWCLVL